MPTTGSVTLAPIVQPLRKGTTKKSSKSTQRGSKKKG